MRLDLYNFDQKMSSCILKRGKDYYHKNAVIQLQQIKDGVYHADVIGNDCYHVEIILNQKEELVSASCSCPYHYDAYCKHEVAVLYTLRHAFSTGKIQYSRYQSSTAVSTLIADYHNQYETEAEMSYLEQPIRLVPELHYGNDDTITAELKIGNNRMYIIKDISQLQQNFEEKNIVRYGKNLEFRHSYTLLTEKEQELLQFLNMLLPKRNPYSYYYAENRRKVKIPPAMMADFFLLLGESAIVDGETIAICQENPPFSLKIKQEKYDFKKKYILKTDETYHFLGNAKQICFYNPEQKKIYIASTDFSMTVGRLLEVLMREPYQQLYIFDKDMPAFYSTVLQPISAYLPIQGMELLEEFAPPEIQSQLYLDALEEDTICGRLEFVYDTMHFAAFEEKKKRVCNLQKEMRAEHDVLQYFTYHPEDSHHPLLLTGEAEIYRLITEGIPLLSKEIELYASDRFQRITVRPPVRPTVGIRPDNHLLELDIHAEGYDQEELLELLSAYRKGQKYHRLRDGSFAVLTDSGISAFSELAEGLNLTNKEILQQQMQVPQYRMLYLDSLQSQPNGIRLQRSSAFCEAVQKYHAMTEQETEAVLPPALLPILRPYQKQGFCWMHAIAAYGFGGILADDMGLGKTLQAIALMCSEKQTASTDEHRMHLVVCPSSLTLNWKSEIEKFAPDLKTAIVIGIAATRKQLLQHATDYDVLVTSYSLLARDIAFYQDLSFDLHFLDEAQYIKNHTTQAAKAVKGISSRIRFALTGTPVENTLAELWSIFDFIMPKYLFNYNKFKSTYETPIVKKKDTAAVKSLQKVVAPFILRRMKKDVLTELPEKTETVLLSEMEEPQDKLYAATVLQTKQMLAANNDSNSGENKLRILAMLTRLRQICCDPSLVYDTYQDGSAKLEQCMELVESCVHAGHKLLLFSQFTSMLDIIAERLRQQQISFFLLTGATKASSRMEMVNTFNQDDTSVFLISLKAGGTGLNLTGADIVIHYDPWWNLSAEQQATDRVYRIGQKKNVQIYKLIAKGTIEEKIQQMQEKKAELAQLAIAGDADLLKMSAEDIATLLE